MLFPFCLKHQSSHYNQCMHLQATRNGIEIGAARADRLEAAQPEAQPSLPETDLRQAAGTTSLMENGT